jgi:two-component system nitrogen regulation response regulator GlnG
MSSIDGSTAGLSAAFRGAPAGSEAPAAVPALTLLCHPDLGRVGDRALLGELLHAALPLSRTYPDFLPPGGGAGGPLADRHLSRTPLLLRPAGEGIELCLKESRTSVIADGVSITGTAFFTLADLARGVVLELSGRIVLLLHHFTPPAAEPARRFGLVGDSAEMARIRLDIERIADLGVPVLLRGETGTGKELVARAIHEEGPRRGGPFVGINLGAIPASLCTSELFGAVQGAFTGAVRAQDGYFRRADGGTLFLDEVGEAPPEVQVMLLRALETSEIQPVGSQRLVRVDVRVIAATDSDLEARIRKGDFREPLLHRLAGYEVWLPPLRQRRDDFGRLLVHFLSEELARLGESRHLATADQPWLPAELVARLARFSWPGNVRQLRNVARQLVIGSRGLPRATPGPQIERLLRTVGGEPWPAGRRPVASGAFDRRRPAEVTDEELLAALRASRWDLKATAERLRISRTSLYALIDGSGHLRKAGDLSPDEITACHRECDGDLDAMVERLQVSRRALGRRVRELGLPLDEAP